MQKVGFIMNMNNNNIQSYFLNEPTKDKNSSLYLDFSITKKNPNIKYS